MMDLLLSRRFGPFFLTQFLVAFNDNVFKNALVILIAFRLTSEASAGFWINLSSALFILPYFLFSPLAGQLADKYEKSRLIRLIKISEIVIMAIGAAGFLWEKIELLAGVLFLMGTHSTFFGPIKYSILPQHLREKEIMPGTSLVEMGTFVSILIGTMLGGLLVRQGVGYCALAVVLIAIVGWLVSLCVPEAKAADPDLAITLNPSKEFKTLYSIAKQNDSIFYSITGISWFWFLGGTVLAQIPIFVKHTLNADEVVITLFLSVFTLSIAIGSFICNRLSRSVIEPGLVPIGALGTTFFIWDIGAINYLTFAKTNNNITDFLLSGPSVETAYRIIFDMAMIGVFASFFIVPMYAILQDRSLKQNCSRVIAANNIANSVYMVVSSVFALAMHGLGYKTTDIFLAAAVLNFFVCGFIFVKNQEFVLRCGSWILSRFFYNIEISGAHNIPKAGPGFIVANHASFIDWFLIAMVTQRPVRFVVDYRTYHRLSLNWLFSLGKCIPFATESENREIYHEACALISEAVGRDELVCMFPERKITRNGEMEVFHPELGLVLAKNDVNIYPIALKGLWGSLFSMQRNIRLRLINKNDRRRVAVSVMRPTRSHSIRLSEIERQIRRQRVSV